MSNTGKRMPKSHIITSVCLGVWLCLFSILPAYAGPSVRLNADDVYAFATKSYTDGDYSTAAIGFKAFVFYFPNDKRCPRAHFSIAMTYFKTQRYGKAEAAFQETARQYPQQDVAVESLFMISRCYLKLDDASAAIDILRRIADLTDNPAVRDRARDRLGWVYLENGEIGPARAAFYGISDAGQPVYHVKEILAQLDRPQDQLPYKSPVVAGVLSIIPGGGYLYCGRYQDALISFLVNAGLGLAAYESFDKDLYALGGLVSVVNLGFYGGNIYGGISSAHKYNDRIYDAFIGRLREQTRRNEQKGPGLSLWLRPRGVGLAFNYRF